MRPDDFVNILEIDEILRTFLQFCDKPTLARLARSSKLFCDPALDVLWENLESFSHLLKLFPKELITWGPSDSPPVLKPTVNHLIVPRDWKRFETYAHRVKSWSPEDLSYIEEPVVDHIAFGRNPNYILPRLTHLEVTAKTVSGVHLQTLILCPSLESVTVWNPEPGIWATRAMNAFFRTLADRASNLRKLTVHWGEGAGTLPFVDGLSDVFSQEHSALNSVNLWSPECVDAKGFALLAKLPSLTTLHLNLTNIEDAYVLCSEVKDRSNAFPSLQNLFLAGLVEEFPKMLRFFANSLRMTSLGFSVREYPTSKQLLQLFNSVASNFPRLRILQLNAPKEEINAQLANRSYLANQDHYQHDLAVLQPLLTIRSLVALHLEIGVPLYLTDTDLCVIGTAWPAIEVLDLCSDPHYERSRSVQPTASVHGLLAVAGVCPALQRLGLFVDCTVGLTQDVLESTGVVSRALVSLDVGRSWVVDPPLIAALLSGVFPALKVFQWAGMDSTDSWASDDIAGHAANWRQVFDLLPVFRAVRANERRAQCVEAGEASMNVD
ncbi:hypothetical protein M0805_000252 [Coniferiporia weirii]|nr:hypothetical protein M0805_000252 [Coniferiporia weirii]